MVAGCRSCICSCGFRREGKRCRRCLEPMVSAPSSPSPEGYRYLQSRVMANRRSLYVSKTYGDFWEGFKRYSDGGTVALVFPGPLPTFYGLTQLGLAVGLADTARDIKINLPLAAGRRLQKVTGQAPSRACKSGWDFQSGRRATGVSSEGLFRLFQDNRSDRSEKHIAGRRPARSE